MKTIVQKFGGTSVSTKETRNTAIKKIIKSKKDNNVVVVVSAIGRVGDPYATDTLIKFLKDNCDYIKPREMDILLSCGELISAVVLASMLESEGHRAVALTGGQAGIITDDQHQNAEIIMTNPDYILELLEEDIIPVVAGFQGMTSSGQITTLGRGGSDTSAAIIAASINADAIEIYTDVDGIMTADPRMCEDAHVIPKISYNEVFQMADSGAKVIHPRAVEIAMNANVPLIIKNTFSNEEGSSITQNRPADKRTDSKDFKVITGIAHRLGRLQVQLIEGEIEDENLFQILAQNGISIDMINIFPTQKIFTINEEYKNKIITILDSYKIKYILVDDCCKITVLGERMTGVPGVMARIITALKRENIKILQTSDSLTTIACLINSENTAKAITVLHNEFNL